MFGLILRGDLADVVAPTAIVRSVPQRKAPLGLCEVAQHLFRRAVAFLRQRLEEVDHLDRRLVVLGGLHQVLARDRIFHLRELRRGAAPRVLSDSSCHGRNLRWARICGQPAKDAGRQAAGAGGLRKVLVLARDVAVLDARVKVAPPFAGADLGPDPAFQADELPGTALEREVHGVDQHPHEEAGGLHPDSRLSRLRLDSLELKADGTFLALNAGASVRAFQSLEGDLVLLDTDRAGLAELVRMERVIDERVATSRDAFMAVSSACRYGGDPNHRS